MRGIYETINSNKVALCTIIICFLYVQHLSNSKRKELKKQLRKQQANERKRQRQTGLEAEDFASDESEVILVKDIGCLSI